MSDINVYAGAGGLLDEMVDRAALIARHGSLTQDIAIVDPESYSSDWRAGVLSGSFGDVTRARQSALTQRSYERSDVLHFLGDGDVLGRRSEILGDGQLFPDGPSRIANLSAVLRDFDLSVILFIFDVSLLVSANELGNAMLPDQPWADLFARMKKRRAAFARLQVYAVTDFGALVRRLFEILFDPEIRIREGLRVDDEVTSHLARFQLHGQFSTPGFMQDLSKAKSILGPRLHILA